MDRKTDESASKDILKTVAFRAATMNIIIAGKYAPDGRRPMGGSQSWIATVAAELERLGHTVTLWEPGRPVTGRYDVGIIQHLNHTAPVVPLCAKTVQISHGIIDEERPTLDCAMVAFVSEGVRDFWRNKEGPWDGPIIRQPIDLDFWRAGLHFLTTKRRGAVRFSYRRNELPFASEAAESLGMDYLHVHDATPEQAREILGRARVVFASGRAALEAMACGARVVIYDNRSSYQSALMGPASMAENAHNSYSGRGEGSYVPCHAQIVNRINAAGACREWVERHHDARKVVAGMIEWF